MSENAINKIILYILPPGLLLWFKNDSLSPRIGGFSPKRMY
jgi:hypothetical protein